MSFAKFCNPLFLILVILQTPSYASQSRYYFDELKNKIFEKTETGQRRLNESRMSALLDENFNHPSSLIQLEEYVKQLSCLLQDHEAQASFDDVQSWIVEIAYRAIESFIAASHLQGADRIFRYFVIEKKLVRVAELVERSMGQGLSNSQNQNQFTLLYLVDSSLSGFSQSQLDRDVLNNYSAKLYSICFVGYNQNKGLQALNPEMRLWIFRALLRIVAQRHGTGASKKIEGPAKELESFLKRRKISRIPANLVSPFLEALAPFEEDYWSAALYEIALGLEPMHSESRFRLLGKVLNPFFIIQSQHEAAASQVPSLLALISREKGHGWLLKLNQLLEEYETDARNSGKKDIALRASIERAWVLRQYTTSIELGLIRGSGFEEALENTRKEVKTLEASLRDVTAKDPDSQLNLYRSRARLAQAKAHLSQYLVDDDSNKWQELKSAFLQAVMNAPQRFDRSVLTVFADHVYFIAHLKHAHGGLEDIPADVFKSIASSIVPLSRFAMQFIQATLEFEKMTSLSKLFSSNESNIFNKVEMLKSSFDDIALALHELGAADLAATFLNLRASLPVNCDLPLMN